MDKFIALSLGLWLGLAPGVFAQEGKVVSEEAFRNPPFEYRPITPLQGAGGPSSIAGTPVLEQLKTIFLDHGFGGVMVAPTTDKRFVGTKIVSEAFLRHAGGGLQAERPAGGSPWVTTALPGTTVLDINAYLSRVKKARKNPPPPPAPAYLSREYFDQLEQILAYAKANDRKVVFYDEVGFPSGMANHTTPEKYYRKILEKTETEITGPRQYQAAMPEQGVLMAVVAMNADTLERTDLTPLIEDQMLTWQAPAGDWKVMVFNSVTLKAEDVRTDYAAITDYLDPEAVQWFVDTVYEPHAREIGAYFGDTIIQSFFDDVGIFNEEKTWTGGFNEKFQALTGKDPAPYYPALWYDIGPETEAARVAFFDTRAELLADGFPKVITDWGKAHNLLASGHSPGNYELQPVDMGADSFKFYRAQPVPMADVIFTYPFGRNGFKLISDGADYYDKPVVAAETFNPFSPAGTTAGYRRLMELYIRGITRFIGSGLPKTDVLGGPTAFAEWVGRSSMLLQGGRRISEVAVFYPIAALEAFYSFDAPAYTTDTRWGAHVYHDADFVAVGEMLLGLAHRDFTFLHPDLLLSDKIRIKGGALELENRVNWQSYKILILPGQKVISLKALQKIKAYYDQGGAVVATSLLPSKAAELAGSDSATLANDQAVRSIIKEMFGIDPAQPMPEGVSAVKTNDRQGQAVFIHTPDGKVLAHTLDKLGVAADVVFDGNPSPSSGGGMLSYVHKIKEGRHIYFFANSSDDDVDTTVEVRGKLKPQLWDPATGQITAITQVVHTDKHGQDYTRFPLHLTPVTAMFVLAKE